LPRDTSLTPLTPY